MADLAEALQREHCEVDAALAAFLRGLDDGRVDRTALATTLEALRRHIYAEERILFPPIRHGGMTMPLAVMMSEHGAIWRTMEALEELVADGGAAERIRTTAARLLEQLGEHNQKEEAVVYPAVENLPAEKSAELVDFLAAGLIPDGWYCQES